MHLASIIQSISGGFLLSVLWFDLKFDLLAFDTLVNRAPLAANSLASIKSYYSQVLTMERGGVPLIMAMMICCIVATVYESLRSTALPRWHRALAPLLVIPPIALAGLRVVPDAAELAASSAASQEQAALAVSILRDHLYCFFSIGCFVSLQLTRAKATD